MKLKNSLWKRYIGVLWSYCKFLLLIVARSNVLTHLPLNNLFCLLHKVCLFKYVDMANENVIEGF